MAKKELLFFSSIILVGLLDWLTTIVGVVFFGASEVNPLLSGLVGSSMLIFSAVKLSAITLTSFAFYKAAALSGPSIDNHSFSRKVFLGGYLLTFLILTIVVANNIITIIK